VLHGDVLKVYGTGGFKCDAEVRFAAGMQRDGEVILDDTQYAGAASVRSSRFGVRRGFAESLPLALGEAIDTFVSDVNNVLMLEDAATAREDVHEVAVVEKTDTRPPPRVAAAPPAMRWAIVIGVSDYADTRIPALRYASADAKSFSDWLVDPKGGGFAPSRVKKLLDSDATYENIREALFDWGAHALAEDLMVIYFACHGTGESPDDLDSVYLLPSDAKFDKIASSGFPMWDVETALKHHIKARRVVVIADACHSGGIGREYDIGRRGIEIRPKVADSVGNLGSASESVAVIMASGVGQLSQESKEWGGGHGVFTHYLLEGLKGKADANKDGKVSLGELTPYLSQQVRRATKSRQCPVVAGEYDPTLMIAK